MKKKQDKSKWLTLKALPDGKCQVVELLKPDVVIGTYPSIEQARDAGIAMIGKDKKYTSLRDGYLLSEIF
jgi:hypothetical protein